MFYNCSSLTAAPALPATNLGFACYNAMFWGCTSLSTAPYLPAADTDGEPYRHMFRGCTNLREVKVALSAWATGKNNYQDWLRDVSTSGVFLKPAGLSIEYGNERIPEGWKVENWNPNW